MKKWCYRAIGPVVFLILLIRIDVSAIAMTLGKASIWPVILAYLLFIPSLVVRTVRWRALMSPQNIHIGFGEAFSAYAFSIFVGVVTPGRLGEFSKAFYLKRKGHSIGVSFFSVLLDRFFDIGFLLAFGAAAIFVLLEFSVVSEKILSWLIVLFLLIMGSFWFLRKNRYSQWTARLLRTMVPETVKQRGGEEWRNLWREFKLISSGLFIKSLFLTILAWGINYLAIYLFGEGLGFGMNYMIMACIAAVCSLVTLIPVSIMGLGTRDAALILMLGQYGIPEAGAVAFSTLILSMLLFNAIICSFSLLIPGVRSGGSE